MSSTRFENTATVENDGTGELVLVVEPWASEYSLPPRAVYVLRARSNVAGTLDKSEVRRIPRS
jgi:hypothetical protein